MEVKDWLIIEGDILNSRNNSITISHYEKNINLDNGLYIIILFKCMHVKKKKKEIKPRGATLFDYHVPKKP